MRMRLVDVDTMIAKVQLRPELWDTTLEDYKDKGRKRDAWMEVCEAVFQGFAEKSDADKEILVQGVKAKWRTVRDNFIRSKKKQAVETADSGRKIRQYVYEDQLHFLTKNFDNRSTDPSTTPSSGKRKRKRKRIGSDYVDAFTDYDEAEDDGYNGEEGDEFYAEESVVVETLETEDAIPHVASYGSIVEECVNTGEVSGTNQQVKQSQLGKKEYSVKESPAKMLDHHSQPETTRSEPAKTLTEDEQFFNSLLSSVTELSDLQKLQFRIDVLQALKKAKLAAPNHN